MGVAGVASLSSTVKKTQCRAKRGTWDEREGGGRGVGLSWRVVNGCDLICDLIVVS